MVEKVKASRSLGIERGDALFTVLWRKSQTMSFKISIHFVTYRSFTAASNDTFSHVQQAIIMARV